MDVWKAKGHNIMFPSNSYGLLELCHVHSTSVPEKPVVFISSKYRHGKCLLNSGNGLSDYIMSYLRKLNSQHALPHDHEHSIKKSCQRYACVLMISEQTDWFPWNHLVVHQLCIQYLCQCFNTADKSVTEFYTFCH